MTSVRPIEFSPSCVTADTQTTNSFLSSTTNSKRGMKASYSNPGGWQRQAPNISLILKGKEVRIKSYDSNHEPAF